MLSTVSYTRPIFELLFRVRLSVDEVEWRSGYEFSARLRDEIEDVLKAR